MVGRFLFYLILISATLGLFSQKKKNNNVIVPSNQADSLKLEGVLIEAEKYYILENYAKALESFMVALEMNNQSAAINFKIADVLSSNNEGQKSLAYAIKAIELNPDNKYYKFGLARIYRSIGFYSEAAEAYENILKQEQGDENALYELAELYQISGKTEKMFHVFDRIEKYIGIQEEIIRERQRLLMKENKVDETIKEYQKLIKAFEDDPAYAIEFINFLIQNKKLELAEEELRKLESNKQKSSKITLLKSELAWMNGKTEESLELLKSAFSHSGIDFDSKFQILSNYVLMVSDREDKRKLVEVAVLLADQHKDQFKAQAFAGDMLNQINELEKSLVYYLAAKNLNPSNFNVWQNILNAEATLNKYDSVVIHAESALEYFPNQAILYYYGGTGYLIEKKFKQSIALLEQGKRFTIDPKLLTVFYGQLGDAYNGLKDKQNSYAAYEKALENDKNNDHVLNNYSYFLSLDGLELDKAQEMSSRLVDQHPQNPTYLDTHGWVLFSQGKYKESKKFLEKAAKLGADGTITEHYGDVLFKLGDIEDAIAQWKIAQQQGGGSDVIEKKIAERRFYE